MKTPIHVVRQKCWDNGIFVRVVPIQRGYIKGGFPVKLNLERSGRIVKFGTMEFKQNSIQLSEKIDEIYYSEFDRIN
jgi:hypothetical protein